MEQYQETSAYMGNLWVSHSLSPIRPLCVCKLKLCDLIQSQLKLLIPIDFIEFGIKTCLKIILNHKNNIGY